VRDSFSVGPLGAAPLVDPALFVPEPLAPEPVSVASGAPPPKSDDVDVDALGVGELIAFVLPEPLVRAYAMLPPARARTTTAATMIHTLRLPGRPEELDGGPYAGVVGGT
jgi:hypothetical protein